MNLEESIELLKSVRGNEYVATSDYESALGTVLAEIDRLKSDLYSANTIIDDLVGTKWISVSDILPVDEGDMLILRNGLNGCDMFVASFEGDYWLINGSNEVIEEGVTHWAYLPSLPDEE